MNAVFAATLVTALMLAVPHGWHTIKSNPKLRGSCDPVTLMVVGSALIGIASRSGEWLPPKRGQVLVFVEVDHVNKPPQGHLLGYIVFAGPGTTAATRRATERMLDRLRVA